MVGILLLAVVLQAPPIGDQRPESQQPQPPRNEQQQAPDQKGNPATNAPMPSTVPTVGITAEVEQPPTKEQTDETQESEGGLERATWWLVCVTGALVLVGVVAAVIALKTLSIIRKQTKDAGIAAVAARDAADAALLNAKSIINAERAWIEVNLVSQWPQFDEDGVEISDHTLWGKYSLKVTNYGRTVARLVNFQIWTECVPGVFRIEALTNTTLHWYHTLLASGETRHVHTIDINVDFTDWPSLRAGTKTGIVRVLIHYHDIVQGMPIRETGAVYSLAPNGDFERLTGCNQYT